MRKALIFMVIIFLTLSTTGYCNETAKLSAAAVTVDGILNYYSSMAGLNIDVGNAYNYADRVAYVQTNRERLISHLCKTDAYCNLSRANQVIDKLYTNKKAYHAYSKTAMKATETEYFDTATGHRYIKTGPETYSEFTKKGDFLKTISSDTPLLTQNRTVYALTQDNYILYHRTVQGKKDYKVLPGSDDHPEGWKAGKVLITLR